MRVFISSTAADLAEHRQRAERLVNSMGWQPVLLSEHEAVVGGATVRSCQELVWSCDLFVLIVGFRCGWIPQTGQGGNGLDSITAIELGAWGGKVQARQAGPPLIMFATGGLAQPGEGESPLAAATQMVFRERVRGTQIVHDFPYAPPGHNDASRFVEEFVSKLRAQLSAVRVAIADHQRRLAEERTRQVEAAAAKDRANDWLKIAAGVGFGWLVFGNAPADDDDDDNDDDDDDEDDPPPKRRR